MRIAAFDSGIGGLSAIAPLFHRIPGLQVAYLGDLANLPYGTKSPERVIELTAKNIEWLLAQCADDSMEPDHLVVACNTASAHALEAARKAGAAHGVPVTGVLEPGCRLCLVHKPQRVLILATASTVASGAYEKKLRELGFAGTIAQKACPLFVPLVEDRLTSGPEVEGIIRRYLDPLKPAEHDAVILGCTHYPFLLGALSKLYPTVEWIEAGKALLNEAFIGNASKKTSSQNSELKMFFTDSTSNAAGIARMLEELSLKHVRTTIKSIHPVL